jgi:tyrosinase
MQDVGDGQPNWIDDIQALFTAPYWIDPAQRASTGAGWIGCMSGFAIQLDDYDSVKGASVLIYDYLHSRAMPLGEAPWPDAPLETFRAWVNQGWRRSSADPAVPQDLIPEPEPRPVPIRIRRDLRSLSQAELDDYRARIDEVMRIGDPDPSAPGQQFAAVHGDWCLHYQEAFLLWHRAYLIQFEDRIGCAVPYWNWYAQDASVDSSPTSGLPQAFKDETYVHPGTGETRPNPLRYAAAKAGNSKACIDGPPPGIDCRWVQRDPVLYTSGDDRRAEREEKVGLTLLYQQQVQRALAFPDFSHPEGDGYPWANIQSFDPPPPDSDYVYRNYNFDGAYEQPHDNYHGWVGPDMADNSYTAYDPVFWSYHANIDRIFEQWLRAHPQATFTSAFPLHPFSGPRAERLEFTDPRAFIYTTIGDLAKDSRGLGYDFAAPADPDFGAAAAAEAGAAAAAGCPKAAAKPMTAAAAVPAEELLVVFDEVRCNFESFAIDVFIDQPEARPADVSAANPNYVGRLSRIGMGQEDPRNRCIKRGVPRIIEATSNAERLGIESPVLPSLTLLVTDLADGRPLSRAEIAALPDFKARLLWTKLGWAPRSAATAVASNRPSLQS